MLLLSSVFGWVWILANTIFAADLLSTLRSSDASLLADTIEANPDIGAVYFNSSVRTIFAPIDRVLAKFTSLQRAWAIRRAINPGTALQASYGVAKNLYDFQNPDNKSSSTITKRADDSLPFLFTTVSDKVPANLEDGERQKFTMIDGGEQHGGNDSHAPVLQLVTGFGNKVSVVKPSIEYDGGAIYTVDGLFTIPESLSNTLAQLPDTTSFGALLNQSNFTTAFDRQAGGTFFIPSNDAVATARSCNLTINNNIIENHVVKGDTVYLPELQECGTWCASNGGVLTVTKTHEGKYQINGANIISTNIILENGVAYVIDKVLTPPATPIAPYPPLNSVASSTVWKHVKTAGVFAFCFVLAVTFLA